MSVGELQCPFCGSLEVELVSAWGGQLITSQVRCRACNSHFEALRHDFGGSAPDYPPARLEGPDPPPGDEPLAPVSR
jgi:hypothetical protein